MKTILIFTLTIFISFSSFAQDSYQEAIEMGDRAFRKENFRKAINYYFAAEAFNPSKKVVVKEKINKVFNRIERLKQEAVRAKVEAEQQRQIAISEKEKANASNLKNQKLIDAFYFYNDKYALAVKKIYGEKKYGFINKDAETVIEYKYDKAEQFDKMGFAKVQIRDGYGSNSNYVDYLIDTLGNEYPVAYKPEDVTKDTKAMYLTDKAANGGFPYSILTKNHLEIIIIERVGRYKMDGLWNTIPKEIQFYKNLKILRFSGFPITTITKEIGKLEALERLELMDNKIKKIPKEIGNLTQLKVLNLYGNLGFDTIPDEIRHLKQLRHLNLGETNIGVFIPAIFELTNLESLIRSCNMRTGSIIRHLPPEIGNLKKLKVLNLQLQEIEKVPTEIGNLTELEYLDLTGNGILELPYSIGNLTKLKELHIGGLLTAGANSLDKLPISMKNMKELERLDLCFNGLGLVPDVIFEMKNLKFLNYGDMLDGDNPLLYTKPWNKLKHLEELRIGVYMRELEVDIPKLQQVIPNCKIVNGW